MPTLHVTDREQAELLLVSNPPAALVSCHDPAAEPCEGFDAFAGPKIATFFADSEPEDRFMGEAAATVEHLESVIAWAEDIRDLEGTVLVHCNAGIGRSPAVACMLQCLWDGVTIHAERSLSTALKGCTTGPMPNEHIARLGDKLLNRDREMLWAVQVFNERLKACKMY